MGHRVTLAAIREERLIRNILLPARATNDVGRDHNRNFYLARLIFVMNLSVERKREASPISGRKDSYGGDQCGFVRKLIIN